MGRGGKKYKIPLPKSLETLWSTVGSMPVLNYFITNNITPHLLTETTMNMNKKKNEYIFNIVFNRYLRFYIK
jgi:hypothetical protein